MKKALFTTLLVSLLSGCLQQITESQQEPTDWTELIPHEQRETILALIEEERAFANEYHDDLIGPQEQSMGIGFANINHNVISQDVKLAGFVVPLEWNDYAVTEFLLVPYFGACIHMPPPPANQMVHVKYPQGVENLLLRDAIWLEGTLEAQAKGFDTLGEVAYTISNPTVSAY
ncbi:DUF3299 domain-containing protein [Photobacterium sp. DNB22_13_2]